jgi:hypothetical protein
MVAVFPQFVRPDYGLLSALAASNSGCAATRQHKSPSGVAWGCC